MRRVKLSQLSILLGAVFFVMAFSNQAITKPDGPATNRCGLYGTQPTCTACHSASGTNNATATISIAGNPTGYTPGQVYAITVAGTGGASYGFELAAVRSTGGANAGSWTNVTGTETASASVSGNSISFIHQSTPKNAGTWTFNWTAPSTNVGSVAFYLAILATNTNNGTGSSSGDKTKTATLTLPVSVTCTAPATPTNLTTTNITATTATFNWSAVSGAANYTIQGRKVGTTNWTTIGPVTGTSKTVSAQLVACKTYEWQVQASCATGGTSSAFSPSATFTTTCKTDEDLTATAINTFNLSPNPANSFVNVSYTAIAQSQINVRVFDMAGKTLIAQTKNVAEGENSFTIDTNELPNGFYLVEISNGETKQHNKLLISK